MDHEGLALTHWVPQQLLLKKGRKQEGWSPRARSRVVPHSHNRPTLGALSPVCLPNPAGAAAAGDHAAHRAAELGPDVCCVCGMAGGLPPGV